MSNSTRSSSYRAADDANRFNPEVALFESRRPTVSAIPSRDRELRHLCDAVNREAASHRPSIGAADSIAIDVNSMSEYFSLSRTSGPSTGYRRPRPDRSSSRPDLWQRRSPECGGESYSLGQHGAEGTCVGARSRRPCFHVSDCRILTSGVLVIPWHLNSVSCPDDTRARCVP
jgi:hypothetical protein